MNPINYAGMQSQNNVVGQAMQGYAQGAAIRDDQQQQRQMVQAQVEARRVQSGLMELSNNPNASAEDYSKFIMQNPSMATHVKDSYAAMDEAAQSSNKKFVTNAYAAAFSGNNDIAKEIIQRRIDAGGTDQDVALSKTMLKVLENNPNAAKTMFGVILGSIEGKESFAQTHERLANVANTEADTLKAESDIVNEGLTTTATVGLDEAKTLRENAETDKIAEDSRQALIDRKKGMIISLSPSSETLLNKTVVSATNSTSLAGKYKALGAQFTASIGSGALARADEAAARFWGSEDDVSMLRRNYDRLKNASVISALPAGPATDKDIELIQKGFPDSTANAETLSDFIGAMERTQRYEASVQNMQADWISNNGNLGSAKVDSIISGRMVRAGTPMSQFLTSTDLREPGHIPAGMNMAQAEQAETEWNAGQQARISRGLEPLSDKTKRQAFADELNELKKKDNSKPIAPWEPINKAFAERGKDFWQETQLAAKEYGVDPKILSIQQGAESMYKPDADSGQAKGLTQFIPSTAKQYGVKFGNSPEAVTSQIKGQAKYMSDLLKRYKGDYNLAVFAYNQGPGNVNKWLAGEKMTTTAGREYVKRILGVGLPQNGSLYSGIR